MINISGLTNLARRRKEGSILNRMADNNARVLFLNNDLVKRKTTRIARAPKKIEVALVVVSP